MNKDWKLLIQNYEYEITNINTNLSKIWAIQKHEKKTIKTKKLME
jgi:hypothetical protein